MREVSFVVSSWELSLIREHEDLMSAIRSSMNAGERLRAGEIVQRIRDDLARAFVNHVVNCEEGI